MTDYLTLQEILHIHALSIEHYGGAQGVRDMGAIEAALFRPRSGYYSDIIEEATALLESLLINHPFVDGNKRVALAVCCVFLEINGCLLDAEPAWLHEHMLAWIDAREDRFQRIVQDLRSCVKITP
jgi:death-on-curing protein